MLADDAEARGARKEAAARHEDRIEAATAAAAARAGGCLFVCLFCKVGTVEVVFVSVPSYVHRPRKGFSMSIWIYITGKTDIATYVRTVGHNKTPCFRRERPPDVIFSPATASKFRKSVGGVLDYYARPFS